MGILAIVAFKAVVSGPVRSAKRERPELREEIMYRPLPARGRRNGRRGLNLAIWPGTGELLEEVDVFARSWGDWTATYWDHLPKVHLHSRCWDPSSQTVRTGACPECIDKAAASGTGRSTSRIASAHRDSQRQCGSL
jgi:hypothetical protein